MNSPSLSIGSSVLTIELGDITKYKVDAIVNAANTHLMHGGGVAAAIARAAGPVLQEESRRVAPVRTGDAAITSGGKLPARYVIHAVGPRWIDGRHGEPEDLRSAIEASLSIAERYGLKSIAFPAISTGIYGYPIKPAAEIMISTISQYLEQSDLERVVVVLYSDDIFRTFQQVLESHSR